MFKIDGSFHPHLSDTTNEVLTLCLHLVRGSQAMQTSVDTWGSLRITQNIAVIQLPCQQLFLYEIITEMAEMVLP